VDKIIFDEEDLSLLPQVGGLNNLQFSLEYFVDSLNDTFGEIIFSDTTATSELTHLSGEKTLFLDGENTSYNVLTSHADGQVFVNGGSHNFLQADGNINLNLSDGDVLIYLDNLNEVKSNIEILQGNLSFAINDSSIGFGEFKIEGDKLYAGETETGITIESANKGPISISIHNLATGQEWGFENDFNPDSTSPTEEPSNVKDEAKAELVENDAASDRVLLSDINDDLIFGDSFDVEFETISPADFEILGSGPSLPDGFSLSNFFSESLDLLTADLDEIMASSPDLELISEQNVTDKALKIDDLIDISDYSSLEWASAIEIIEEI
jgi:hypothetical protein